MAVVPGDPSRIGPEGDAFQLELDANAGRKSLTRELGGPQLREPEIHRRPVHFIADPGSYVLSSASVWSFELCLFVCSSLRPMEGPEWLAVAEGTIGTLLNEPRSRGRVDLQWLRTTSQDQRPTSGTRPPARMPT